MYFEYENASCIALYSRFSSESLTINKEWKKLIIKYQYFVKCFQISIILYVV